MAIISKAGNSVFFSSNNFNGKNVNIGQWKNLKKVYDVTALGPPFIS